jgi:RNA polymerase sigma-70 factor (ECF subfamily)
VSRFSAPETLLDVKPALRVVEPASAVGDVEEAFRAYSGYVAAVAARLLGRDGEVDDVVQETFIVAMKGLDRLRDPAAVKDWLATVTVRIARRRLRLRRFFSVLRREGSAADAEELVSRDASPEDRAVLARVYAALDAIPVNQRIAWTLRHVEGEQLDRVARLCGCSLATAKRRITAAHELISRLVCDE